MDNAAAIQKVQEVFIAAAQALETEKDVAGIKLMVSTPHKTLYVSPALDGRLSWMTQASVREDNRAFFAQHPYGAASAVPVGGDGVDFLSLAINDQATGPYQYFMPYNDSYTLEMYAYSLFDHEFGHCMVKRGLGYRYPSTMNEAVADAFQALRHIQRFGPDTGARYEDLIDDATSLVIYADDGIISSHYTAGVVYKVHAMKNDPALPGMGLQETFRLARKIAHDYAMDGATLARINEAYAPVREVFNRAGRIEATVIAAIVDVVEKVEDPAVQLAGLLCVKGYMARTKMGYADISATLDADKAIDATRFRNVFSRLAWNVKVAKMDVHDTIVRRREGVKRVCRNALGL